MCPRWLGSRKRNATMCFTYLVDRSAVLYPRGTFGMAFPTANNRLCLSPMTLYMECVRLSALKYSSEYRRREIDTLSTTTTIDLNMYPDAVYFNTKAYASAE